MEYGKQPQTPTDAPVKIYQPQVKSVAVRQQTGFLGNSRGNGFLDGGRIAYA